MKPISIRYIFNMKGDRSEEFNVQLDPDTLEIINPPTDDLPDWTRLEFHQCSHCPFTIASRPRCPVAVSLVGVIDHFTNVVSHNEIDLTVITNERQVSQKTTAQKGVSSLVGLLFATSGCPHTGYLKPMARYHLPLASEDETYYRAIGMYLLAQYFLHNQGREADLELEGLKLIYRNLHKLNTMIAERIRSATRADSSVNAVVLLDMISNLMPFVLDEQLHRLRHLFRSYTESQIH
ncbi:MAG TPA: hypothetical protein DDY20_06025 [Desulfobulbaceae bacterium]|nr:hypothetical protein [Desulfobulbaceae bacterium]